MNRREFIYVSAGAMGVSVVNACDPECWGAISKPAKHPGEISAAEFHAGRQFVKTGQGRIAYLDRGRGPAAIFLHGFPLNSFQWRGIIPRLSHARRCIALDFLALGFTEVNEGQSVEIG